MSRINKKEIIASLHRETILCAAEKIFYEKGFNATTIDDLSNAANYSRRTIYTYFKNKEDILYNVILKGLKSLHGEITLILQSNGEFISQYFEICQAMTNYQRQYPHSFDSVNNMKNSDINFNELPKTIVDILSIGTQINLLLENYLQSAQQKGYIQSHLNPKQTVYILWANLSSIITLANNKGPFLCQDLNITVEQFLHDGFTQIINSILVVRI